MRRLLFGMLLVLAAGAARAQATRYANTGHLSLNSQPGLGFELPAYLGLGDSVQVVSTPPTANPHHLSDRMRRNFVYVSYPPYRGQPAGTGWVLRHYLVSTHDSAWVPTAAVPAQTYTTTKVVTTRRYVPVTDAIRPRAETGKAVRVVTTARPAPRRASSLARSYYTGARGGCYYLGAGGQKVYVDHSYCK